MKLIMSVWIPGRPKTKGSLTVVNNARGVVADTPASKRWRALVAYQAGAAMASGSGPIEGPVVAAGVFWLPVADVTTKGCGDLDKLIRNVLDALTDAGVYGDDVQVTRVMFDKAPATAERGPGLDLRVLVP